MDSAVACRQARLCSRAITYFIAVYRVIRETPRSRLRASEDDEEEERDGEYALLRRVQSRGGSREISEKTLKDKE